MTESEVEIDLVVERPGEKLLFIEIKSSNTVRKEDLSSMERLVNDFDDCEAVCFRVIRGRRKWGVSRYTHGSRVLKNIFQSNFL